MVPRRGFEPRTNSLKGYCSTTELTEHVAGKKFTKTGKKLEICVRKKTRHVDLKISSINYNHLIIAVCAFTYSINNLPFFIAFECFVDNRHIPTGYDLLRRQVKKRLTERYRSQIDDSNFREPHHRIYT